MYRTLTAGALILSLGLPGIIEAKNHINCEEHLGSKISDIKFLDKSPAAKRKQGMLIVPPEPTPNASREEIMACIKRRVEEISYNKTHRYSIFPYTEDGNLYVIREIKREND